MFGHVLAQSDGISISRVITVLSILLSMLSLGVAFWKARAFLPLRPVFDYARLAIQLVAVTVMAWLSGVSTAPALLVGAALLGGGLGYFQGSSIEVAVDEGVVRLRRSIIGVGIWGSGLILMQVAGLANRAGVVRLGQAIAWFSIGLGIGLLIGREPRVRQAVRATGAAFGVAVLVASSVGVLALSDVSPAAAQSGCPSPPNGWQQKTSTSDGICSYESTFGDTAAISESGGRKCGAELAEHWAGFPGSPGAASSINIRNDGTSGFEKWLVLTPNSVISIAASNVPGPGTVERFVPAANEFARVRYAACGGSSPTTTAGNGTNPQTTQAPRTTIVTETFPDDPPPVATIEDEGVNITSTTAAPTTTDAPTSTQEAEQTTEAPAIESSTSSTTSTSIVTTTTSGSGEGIAFPPIDGGDDVDRGEDDVTPDEAVQQAVAGFLLAGLLGLISWAEAFQAIDAISGSAPGTAQATHGHLQTQFPDNKAPAPSPAPPSGAAPPKPPIPPGGSTPASSYLPQTPPAQGGAGGTPPGTPGQRSPWYPPEGQDGPGNPDPTAPDDPNSVPENPDDAPEAGDSDGGSGGTTFGDWGLGDDGQTSAPDGEATGGAAPEPAPEPEIEFETSNTNSDGSITSEGVRANGDKFDRVEHPDAIGREVLSEENITHRDGSTTTITTRADGSTSTSRSGPRADQFSESADDGKGNTSSFVQDRAGHTVATSTTGDTTTTNETIDGIEVSRRTGPDGSFERVDDPVTGHRQTTEVRADGTRIETLGVGDEATVTTTRQQGTVTTTTVANPDGSVDKTVEDSAKPGTRTQTTTEDGDLVSRTEHVDLPGGGTTVTKTEYFPDGRVRQQTVNSPDGFELRTPRPDGGTDVFRRNSDGTSVRTQLDANGQPIPESPPVPPDEPPPVPEPKPPAGGGAGEPEEPTVTRLRPPLPRSEVAEALENDRRLQGIVGRSELQEVGDFIRDKDAHELSVTPPESGTTLLSRAGQNISAGTPYNEGGGVKLPVSAGILPAGEVSLEVDSNGMLQATIEVNSVGRGAARVIAGDTFDQVLDDVQQSVSLRIDDINGELYRTGRRLTSVSVDADGDIAFTSEPRN